MIVGVLLCVGGVHLVLVTDHNMVFCSGLRKVVHSPNSVHLRLNL